ncbi:MAG: S41 family peptidase [Rhodospirillales bacterium]
MTRWKHVRTAFLVAIALIVGGNLIQALNGCSGGGPPVGRVAEAIGFDPYPLSDGNARELARFNAAFTTYAADPDNTRQLKHFRDAYKRILAAYVDEVPAARLIDAAVDAVEEGGPAPGSLAATSLVEKALDGMTAALDPHTVYLNPEELQETELMATGRFGGLGIQVTQEEGLIKVVSPIEDTPADRAGLKTGDRITHVDGQPVRDMRLMEAVRAMRGEPGTRVRLIVVRGAEAPFDVVLTREIITVRPVRWRTEGDVGYLRIVSFNERTADAVEAAMKSLRAELGPGGKGVVVDVRSNPGGLLDQSLAVADAFLDGGVVVSMRGRDPAEDRSFRAAAGDVAAGMPIVVLIDGGSASAAEIVAAALQEQNRATVMGSKSFGKGSVQTVMRLPVEGALKMTTALYYTPSGETLQARGVTPDIVLNGDTVDDGERVREADLPGAFGEQGEDRSRARAALDAAACPAVGEAGKEDHHLGCAIALLRAGSTAQFLASVGVRAGI